MQELWFLCMTRHLNVLYKRMKVRCNVCNGYQVIERTPFCDGQTDRHTDARGKTICLPTLAGGRHNFNLHEKSFITLGPGLFCFVVLQLSNNM